MRIIFSRKGFDSSAGRKPSPIVEGRPISLPIPTSRRSRTSYGDLGLGDLVERTTRGGISATNLCHDDPLFDSGQCWFGQCAAAQGHLEKRGVTIGDVFLFFGLFTDEMSGEKHHRIFGFMRIECMGSPEAIRAKLGWTYPPRPHPHFIGEWNANNTVYYGRGRTANHASPSLRLTKPGGPLNSWIVPAWLHAHGLSYHDKPERWVGTTELDSAKRGQEFVSDVGESPEAHRWLEGVIAEIER